MIETKTGKPAGADVARRKKSLPGCDGAQGSGGDAVRAAYERLGKRRMTAVVATMEESAYARSAHEWVA